MKTIVLAALAILITLGTAQAFKATSLTTGINQKYCAAARVNKPPLTCPMNSESPVGAPCSCISPGGARHAGIVQVKTLKTEK